MAVAKALVEEADGLDDKEKKALTKSLDDLVRDVPETETAIMRVKKYLPKAGATVAAAFKEVMVSVATEAVKQKLWP